MPVAQPPYPGWTLDACRLQPAPLTELLEDGDKVDLGNRVFAVLHLPGHSIGSIALLDERTGEFFSGDAIYDDTLVDDVPGADGETYLKTMDRLLALDIGIGHGGHGPSYTKQRMQEIARSYIASKRG
jgi:glyoxylase-like metal-dependent hydrolase (beta-lactamase superfamily II)